MQYFSLAPRLVAIKPFERSFIEKVFLVLAMVVFFIIAFQITYPSIGIAACSFSFITVGIISAVLGPWVGLASAIIFTVLSVFLYYFQSGEVMNLLVYWPAYSGLVFFGGGLGWMRDRFYIERANAKEHEKIAVKLQRQNQELELLNEIRTALAQEVEVSKIVEITIQKLSSDFSYTEINLYLLDGDQFKKHYPNNKGPLRESFPTHTNFSRTPLQHPQVLLLDEAQRAIEFLGLPTEITSILIVPILKGDQLLGLLNLASQSLTHADVQLMTNVAQHLMIALERARLFSEIRNLNESLEQRVLERTNALAQANAELQRQANERQILLELTRNVLFNLSPSDLLTEVLQSLGGMMAPGDILGLYWYAEATAMLEPFKFSPPTPPCEKPLQAILLGQGITGSVAQTQQAELVNHVNCDPRITNPADLPCTSEHLISIPLQARNKLLGVLNISRPHDPPFSQSEFELAQLFLSLAEVALDNANLFEQVKNREVVLEARIQERTASLQVEVGERKQAEKELKDAYLYLRLKTEALERSKADLEQFTNIAYHDLQEPLRQVTIYTQKLARYTEIETETQEWMGFIIEGAYRMQNLLKGLLRYSHIGQDAETLKPVDSNEVLRETLSGLKKAIDEKQAVISHSPLPIILSNPFLLSQLFNHLIGNALKFSQFKAPQIYISATPPAPGQVPQAMWKFAIQDNGIGIDAMYFDRIFEIFQRLHPRDAYGGTGIGLAICKKIIERYHGGRIWVESCEGEGATFFFTIPAVKDYV